MLPAAEPLVNHSNSFRQSFLTDPLVPPSLENEVRLRVFRDRIVAKESQDARPLRNDGLSFITFPAFVNLT